MLLYPLSLSCLIVLDEKSNILFDMVYSSFLRFTRIIFPISYCPTSISEYCLGLIAIPWFLVFLSNRLFMTLSFTLCSFAILINSLARSTKSDTSNRASCSRSVLSEKVMSLFLFITPSCPYELPGYGILGHCRPSRICHFCMTRSA